MDFKSLPDRAMGSVNKAAQQVDHQVALNRLRSQRKACEQNLNSVLLFTGNKVCSRMYRRHLFLFPTKG